MQSPKSASSMKRPAHDNGEVGRRKMLQKRVGAVFLLLCVFSLQGEAQQNAAAAPILEARDISQGCCSGQYDRTYLRVFGDGTVEWEAFDEHGKVFVAHHETLSKKKLRAIQWAIDSMKGLKDFYVGKGAENNIDDDYRFAITGRRGVKIYKTEIGFGLPVSEENYSGQPSPLRTVVCNIAETRSELAHEKADLEFCKKYYVGW